VFTNYKFRDGALIMAEGGWDPSKPTPFEMSFQIVCEKRTIRLSETGYKVLYEDGRVEEPKPALENFPTGWHVEIDYFLSSILNGTYPDKYLSTAEMRDSMAIIEAEVLSIKENHSVTIKY
jgi:predicted dehydrogenase